MQDQTDKTKTPRELALEWLIDKRKFLEDARYGDEEYLAKMKAQLPIVNYINEALSQEQPEPIEGLSSSIAWTERWNEARNIDAGTSPPTYGEIQTLVYAARQFHNLTKEKK